jgi:hypothetical protein
MPKPKPKALRIWALTFQVCETAKSGTTLPEQVDIERCFQDKLDAYRYVFQYERGESGSEHIQAHLELKEPITGSALREKIRFSGGIRQYYHSGCLTTTPVHDTEASYAYACKEETLIRGPFKFPAHFYVGGDLIGSEKYPTPLPWQQQTLDWIDAPPDERTVHVIYGSAGCEGKTKLSKTLCYFKRALKVPFGLSVQQGIAAIISQPAHRVYLVDIPRSNIDDRLVWETVEGLKNGHVVSSWRGVWREKFFDAPHVLVFCNRLPDLSHLSMDRWRLWEVSTTGSLESLDKFAVLQMQQRDKRLEDQNKSRRRVDFIK